MDDHTWSETEDEEDSEEEDVEVESESESEMETEVDEEEEEEEEEEEQEDEEEEDEMEVEEEPETETDEEEEGEEEEEEEEEEDEEDEMEVEEESETDEEEEEEVGELISPARMIPRVSNSVASRNVSSSIADSRTLQRTVVVNNGFPDNSVALNRYGIDGLDCPICYEAWSSSGEHQICHLPCGHLYGLSCIKKWLQLSPNSRRCPQCNGFCMLKDVRVL